MSEKIALTGGSMDRGRTLWNRQVDEISALKTENARLIGLLREAVSEIVWGAYYEGIERDGKWMDGARKDATQLQTDLGLTPGWHDASLMRSRIPEAVEIALKRVLEADHG